MWGDTHQNIIFVTEKYSYGRLLPCVFPAFFKLGNHDNLVISGPGIP